MFCILIPSHIVRISLNIFNLERSDLISQTASFFSHMRKQIQDLLDVHLLKAIIFKRVLEDQSVLC